MLGDIFDNDAIAELIICCYHKIGLKAWIYHETELKAR